MKDTGKGAVFLPHTAGRYAARRFRKAQVCSECCEPPLLDTYLLLFLVPHCWTTCELTHDARTQQRQKDDGCDNCQAFLWDHSPAHWRGTVPQTPLLTCYMCHPSPPRTLFKYWLMLFRTVGHVKTPPGLAELGQFVVRQLTCLR